MNIDSIVQIWGGQKGDSSELLGTGYLIASDRILTAWHVVDGVDSVEIVVDDPRQGDVLRLPATLLWSPSGTEDSECDIALLQLDEPVRFPIPTADLAEAPARANRPWRSRGFPRIAVQRDKVRDSAIAVSGEAAEFAPDQQYVQLWLDQETRVVEGWKGLSGAPVFEKAGTGRLFAVVAEKQDSIVNGLLAIPLTRAFALPSFREALGAGIAHERRDALIEDVRGIVHGMKDETVALLAREREDWSLAFGDLGDRHALVDCMLGVTDLSDLLVAFDNAHSEVHKSGSREPESAGEARKMAKVVRRLAPVLVESHVVSAFPSADPGGGLVLDLPVGEVPWGELALALFEGRASRFRICERAELRPLHQMPSAVEAGIDLGHQNLLAEYADYLRRNYLPVIHDAKFEGMKRSLGESRAYEELFKALNQFFDKDAGRSVHGKRRLFFLVEAWSSEHDKAFFRDLQRRLPALHLVELRGGDLATETSVSQILHDLLRRDETGDRQRAGTADEMPAQEVGDEDFKEAS